MPQTSVSRTARFKLIGLGLIVTSVVTLAVLGLQFLGLQTMAPATAAPSSLQPASLQPTLPQLLEHLVSENRLTVFFYPRVEECTPREMFISSALRRSQTAHPDIRVYTVVPEGTKSWKNYGIEPPGDIVTLPAPQWLSHPAPRPRLEVWEHEGTLLLSRSVPAGAVEEDIYEEVTLARTFTWPLDAPPSGPDS